jgi:hypothetical protein
MKTLIRVSALQVLTAGLLCAQAVVGRTEATWSLREKLGSGDHLRITSPNGAITIAQGGGAEVDIRVEKRADRDARIDDIGFIVKRVPTGLVVCAVYADDDECDMERGYRGRNHRSRDERRNRARASFTVRIPAGVLVDAGTGNGDVTINGAGSAVDASTGNGRVQVTNTTGRVKASTGNGAVTVDGAKGEVEASTGNGDVRVTTSSGPVSASSGNGDIDVSMERVDHAEAMSFSTGSGHIVLTMPGDFGAELEGGTGNGRISSDLPIRIAGRIDPHRMRGTLGRGGERLALSTGNGDIEIRKAR